MHRRTKASNVRVQAIEFDPLIRYSWANLLLSYNADHGYESLDCITCSIWIDK